MREKAAILQVGLMDPIRHWVFVGGESIGMRILENGSRLYGGYTEAELRQICDGEVKIDWADPEAHGWIAINPVKRKFGGLS